MKICGIIAEYNPFHRGHAFHLSQTSAVLGSDTALVCVQSGNFVQRGEPALVDKYTRAEMAIRGGADLVLELPLAAALSSAEDFARGAISVLDALGAVRYLSFGSECGYARPLARCAQLLMHPAVQRELHTQMRRGLSYAAALQAAAAMRDPSSAALLSSPNNILGIAYCRALLAAASNISPLAILRRGAAHDADGAADGFASASHVRTLMRTDGPASCKELVPGSTFSLLADAVERGHSPAALSDRALLSHLRRLSPEVLTRYVGTNDGLQYRLFAAIQDGVTFDELCAQARTRRYPLSRVRRALLRAYLDLPASLPVNAQYLRVLAIGAQGRALLRLFSHTAHLPLIVKPLHEKNLPDAVQTTLARDVLADDLYALMLPSSRPAGDHFRKTPYCAAADL